MARDNRNKKERQKILLEKLNSDPFLTDEELAEFFSVSVPTIRLDRLGLGIPELRERMKSVATDNLSKVKSLYSNEIVGELLEVNLNENAISILETNDTMVFEKSKIVRGQYIYAMAESIAMAVINTNVALVGVANIKYKTPVFTGGRLLAKAEVRHVRGDKYFVWVTIKEKQTEVFRGKFILVAIGKVNT